MNEVKRDNETLREIRQFQLSIENLVCDYHAIQLSLIRELRDTLRFVFEPKKIADFQTYFVLSFPSFSFPPDYLLIGSTWLFNGTYARTLIVHSYLCPTVPPPLTV